MRLFTDDESRMIDVGTGSIWRSVYSTALLSLNDEQKEMIPYAMDFLKTGRCSAERIKETEKEFCSVITAFSTLNPEEAVYDWKKPLESPPWKGNIASTVTSCANLYTTSDGEDLFTNVLLLLKYAGTNNLSISAE